MKPLEEIQREFFSALRMPLRGTSRGSTYLAESDEGHSPLFLARADELMKSGENLSSAERLELYHRQYWFRLLDSIAEDFPILRKMAGEEEFWELMEAYLQACPSGSFTLRHLGRGMADFIGGWDSLDDEKRPWFSAVARIEYAMMELFEAGEWETVKAENLIEQQLGLQPFVILLDLPVEADLCEGWEIFEPKVAKRVCLAVWRASNGGRRVDRLEPVEFELLCRLERGGGIADLFAEPMEMEPAADDVARWFTKWQERGWIAVRPENGVVDFVAPSHADLENMSFEGVDKMGSQAMAMED